MIEENILRGCAVRVYKIKLKGKKDSGMHKTT
jgi:hypothetical protein